jgi:hypothetical protein
MVKMGKWREVADLILAENKRLNLPNASRLYTPMYGQFHRVAFEIEFENIT